MIKKIKFKNKFNYVKRKNNRKIKLLVMQYNNLNKAYSNKPQEIGHRGEQAFTEQNNGDYFEITLANHGSKNPDYTEFYVGFHFESKNEDGEKGAVFLIPNKIDGANFNLKLFQNNGTEHNPLGVNLKYNKRTSLDKSSWDLTVTAPKIWDGKYLESVAVGDDNQLP
ncbi:MAG: hypothetical protein KAW12_01070 [Candidatus Aminicenantes bacterium]|nr:hypothetical protein [Candidatus Aminicenantes bacterium]